MQLSLVSLRWIELGPGLSEFSERVVRLTGQCDVVLCSVPNKRRVSGQWLDKEGFLTRQMRYKCISVKSNITQKNEGHDLGDPSDGLQDPPLERIQWNAAIRLDRCGVELYYGTLWNSFWPIFPLNFVIVNKRRNGVPKISPIMQFETTPTQSHAHPQNGQ